MRYLCVFCDAPAAAPPPDAPAVCPSAECNDKIRKQRAERVPTNRADYTNCWTHRRRECGGGRRIIRETKTQ